MTNTTKSKPGLLIVDDDPFCANLLEDFVGSLGFSARCLLDSSLVVDELRRARHVLIELREKFVSSSAPPEILFETALLRLVSRRTPAAARVHS